MGTGKKNTSKFYRTRSGKHPRGDGEEQRSSKKGTIGVETPPWGRGRNFTPSKSFGDVGNTPVGTGKKRICHNSCRANRKHPRGDGEESPVIAVGAAAAETPPWGRGRIHSNCGYMRKSGNTPVGTGKNEAGSECRNQCRKHPRGDGEEGFRLDDRLNQMETPPWGRGRTSAACFFEKLRRNTPVGTGKK